MCRLVLVLLFGSVLSAAEDRLAAIHAFLVPMRSSPFADARGATPTLTSIKHQLRDWIELHLSELQWKDGRWTTNPSILEEQLNDALSQADLFCPQNSTCLQNQLGYLGRVALEMQSGFLVVRTSIGIQTCGTDDSAYIYESTDGRWRLIWQSEQTNYEEKTYLPERLVDVKISPTDWYPESDHSEHLIVTTGVLPWCTSVWQPVYYRVWQTKSKYPDARLLLDSSDLADIGAPIHARASQNDVLIEFQVIADDAMRVPELLHYVLQNDNLRRTDPVALTPQEFVSFWLRHPWNEASKWTGRTGRATLKAWHEQYKGTNSEFTSPTRHCTLHPDLWQVATRPPTVHYFLVRGLVPFRFSMIAASDRPWADCTKDDPAVDKAPDHFGN